MNSHNFNPLFEVATSIDVLYLLGMAIGFVALNFISELILYFIYPILIWSLYQDWRSARVAHVRLHWYFLISDLATVLNYISLFIAMTLPSNPKLGYFERIWLNWSLIFGIYIIWNIVMYKLPDTDTETKEYFKKCTRIELPIAIYSFGIYIEAKTNIIHTTTGMPILHFPKMLLVLMAIAHSGILLYWVYQTYLKKITRG